MLSARQAIYQLIIKKTKKMQIRRVLILLLVAQFIFKAAVAQTGIVSGVVKDSLSGVFLESATVSVLSKDSSLINYKLTDGYGGFHLDKLPLNKNLLLNVTYVGFRSYNKTIKIDSGTFNTTIVLAPAYNDSSAVTVKSYVPIHMNGDTLEINPAAFKMGPNAVVEDLLTQVPGLTVWADGSITMNGRKIPSVLVDGKPFMGSNDPKIATQNLPKDAIDKIQVYQEVDRTLKPDERKQKDSLLTMNIKLKEDKKSGYFGKAGVGYGTTKRFESDLSFQMYNKKSSFGIGGGYNNINKNIDNLTQMFQNNTYRSYNPNLYNAGRFGGSGINKNRFIGGVYTHNFIETTNSRQNDRLTVNYGNSGSDRFLTNLSLQNRATAQNSQFVEDNSISHSSNNNHNIGINYIKTNSYNDNFTINGNASISNNNSNSHATTDTRDELKNLISKNDVQTVEKRKSDGQSFSMNYSKQSEENPLARFNASLNLNNSNGSSDRFVKSNFKSYTNSNDDTAYNRRYSNTNNNLSVGSTLSYDGFKRLIFGRYNFFGIGLSLDNWFNYAKSKNDQKVFDYDTISGSYIVNNSLTNNNQNEKIEYTPSLSFSKSFFKYNGTYYRNFYSSINVLEDLKQDNNTSSFATRNLSRSFAFFRYEGNFGYYYTKQQKYSFNLNGSYRKNFDYPNIDQLYAITDNLDVSNIRIGNPNLQNKINHTYSINGNFDTQNRKSKYAFNGGLSGSFVKSLNPVADSVINDTSGKRYYYYVNVPESKTFGLNYNLNVSRRWGKNSLQLRYSGSYSNNASPSYIDNIYSRTNTASINNDINLEFAYRSMIIFKLGKTLTNYRSDQSGQGLSSFKSYTNISKFGLTVNLPQKYTISSTLDYTKNSNLGKPIYLWNAFASYRFLKSEQAELKFSAMDILKQFKNISNTAGAYGTTTSITNGLQQYFMLTLSYFPRKFGKTIIKKREVKQEW
ncbi:outer membrane beta-barrel protein [Arachidicoccus sp.]|uniref:outer membrane beta-barrel protein n=1 Tax=Arachidicoccus sp. TaxID=1872624 RepID=UPI003D224023